MGNDRFTHAVAETTREGKVVIRYDEGGCEIIDENSDENSQKKISITVIEDDDADNTKK